jgi:hypothetical protein
MAAAALLVSPYLYSVVLIPQSVSIHPYLYDPLLSTPVIMLGVCGMLPPPSSGGSGAGRSSCTPC